MRNNNPNIPDDFDVMDIAKFSSYFSEFSNPIGWRIKIDGGFVKLRSGKSIWSQKGHAKAALREHLNQFNKTFYCYLTEKYLKDICHRDRSVLINKWLEYAEKTGIVEFVELK